MARISVSQRLAELGIQLPQLAPPVAAYIPAKRSANTIRTSGQLPFVDGELRVLGKVGLDVSADEAYQQARICALNALAAIAWVLDGDVDRIVSVSHVTGFVASDPEFYGQPGIVNGASDLMKEIFGDDGVHTRSAVGVAVLPLNAPVEIELSVTIAG
ncbi:RidA family protein [Arcanobacterium phocisimile]|uniref:RidA family protein n=1 Tax=Arcanobacterium phocisimile TaxID=1302235 RepID=A0ABX7IHT6_9ACTO|nr:RidA family protein [Arcanobacterium phocisimile]QRV02094.1 RidA family protein [Arcanobacterium phocisimile]